MKARYQSGRIGRFISVDPVSQYNPEKFLIDPQQLNTYSYSRNNPLRFIDPTGLYNIETGKIEKGDTSKSITSAVNKAFGIKTSWETIAHVSFFQDDFGTTDVNKLIGQSTNVGTNFTADITEKLNGLNKDMANIAFALGPISLIKFKPGGDWDLKNGKDAVLGLGSDGKRNYYSYIYEGDFIRYDAPGNISYGYVARSTGLSDWTVQTGAIIAQVADDYRNNRKVSFKDNGGDSTYVQKGIDSYKANRTWWQKLLNW